MTTLNCQLILILNILATIWLVFSCQKEDPSKNKTKDLNSELSHLSAQPVEVISVNKSTYTEFAEFYGRIAAATNTTLISHTGGTVEKIFKDVGEAFKKGEKLCSIDGDKHETLLQSAKLQASIEQDNLERAELHLKKKTFSKVQYDRQKLSYLTAKNNLIAATQNYDGAFCIAPFNGIVLQRHIELHHFLNPKSPTFFVGSSGKMKVFFEIPETQISGYQPGSVLKIKTSAYGEKTFNGVIKHISRALNQSDKTFNVEGELTEEHEDLRSGMSVTILAQRFNLRDVISIPNTAILNLAGGPAVLVAENNVAVIRPIKIASASNEKSRIESGLDVGDQLITKKSPQVTGGSPIKVVGRD